MLWRNLPADLFERATRRELVYSHRWQAGDIVMDTRSVFHPATAYDGVNRRPLVLRMIISNPGVLATPPYRQIKTRRSA